jgi:hypothetical protein
MNERVVMSIFTRNQKETIICNYLRNRDVKEDAWAERLSNKVKEHGDKVYFFN